MHVNEVMAARRLMQAIDVLRDDVDSTAERAGKLRFQPGEGQVCRVRLDGCEVGAAAIVEFVDQVGVAGEPLGCRNLAIVVLGPYAARIAKSCDTGFGGEAGASQDQDVGEA
jgi:hypothetical protein